VLEARDCFAQPRGQRLNADVHGMRELGKVIGGEPSLNSNVDALDLIGPAGRLPVGFLHALKQWEIRGRQRPRRP
jgi:hypothetical protein